MRAQKPRTQKSNLLFALDIGTRSVTGIAARLAPMLQGLPGVRFLDANTLPGAVCSPVDGMHMTREAHRALAQGLYDLLTGSAPAAH